MSSVITGLLNATFGLLWNKMRDHAASKLKDGDFTDEQFRQMIVREMDDIKSKVDGLARKDLLSSVSFLKEGVRRLHMSLEMSSKKDTNQEGEHVNVGQVEGEKVTETGLVKPAEGFVFNQTFSLALSTAVSGLVVASEERFASAKESFKDARKQATLAFNDEALSTTDRILAAKLRVVSRILESLEDPDAAANDCKLYLEELHAIPAVREIFAVHFEGGVKSLFNKLERLENVKSVTIINFVLCNFAERFTKLPVGIFSWPTIELDERSFYPLYEEDDVIAEVAAFGLHAPCQLSCVTLGTECYTSCSAVNGKGEIFLKSRGTDKPSINVLKSSGEILFFFYLSNKEQETIAFEFHTLAIDTEDCFYAIVSGQTEEAFEAYKVFVFDANGYMIRQFPLDFLANNNGWVHITLDKHKNLLIHKGGQGRVFVYDQSGVQVRSFPLEENCKYSVDLSVSDNNEIIVAPLLQNTVYVYTEEGNLKQTIQLPKDHEVFGAAFNHIAQTVVVFTENKRMKTFQLLNYLVNGGWDILPLRHDADFDDELTYHPNGPVALVHSKGVLFL